MLLWRLKGIAVGSVAIHIIRIPFADSNHGHHRAMFQLRPDPTLEVPDAQSPRRLTDNFPNRLEGYPNKTRPYLGVVNASGADSGTD